jgi:hypothetical protein
MKQVNLSKNAATSCPGKALSRDRFDRSGRYHQSNRFPRECPGRVGQAPPSARKRDRRHWIGAHRLARQRVASMAVFSRLWTTTDMSRLASGGDYNSPTSAALFSSLATAYTKAAGSPIELTTIISGNADAIVKIAIQYVLNQYNLGLFKDEVYGYFDAALKDLEIDYVITDDGDYDSLYGWEDMLSVFSGRYGAITSIQPSLRSNQIFILSSDYNEDTTNGDMVGLAIQYSIQ